DVPGPVASAMFEITPRDGSVEAGLAARTSLFAVDFTPAPVAAFVATTGITGEIAVTYRLTMPAAATVGARVEFDAGSGFAPATPAPGSESLAALAAGPAGTQHTFVWSSAVDVPGRTT